MSSASNMMKRLRLPSIEDVSAKKVVAYFFLFAVVGFVILMSVINPIGDYVTDMLTAQNPGIDGPNLFPAFIMGSFLYAIPISIFLNYITGRSLIWLISKQRKYLVKRVDLFLSFVIIPPLVLLVTLFILSMPLILQYGLGMLKAFFRVDGVLALTIFLALFTTFAIVEISIWGGKKLWRSRRWRK